MRAYEGESAIVYAPTIATVEQTVDFLADREIAAVPYHGQMENGARRRNQERWMNDEVRVMVGTVAFGLGINKPAVRAVIHTSLPKSIEQYYQEAGRAGRDGLPADCVALWRSKDAGLLAYFIDQIAGCGGEAAQLGPLPRGAPIRRELTLPTSADLRALRPDAEVGTLRDVRRLRQRAGVAQSGEPASRGAGGHTKAQAERRGARALRATYLKA